MPRLLATADRATGLPARLLLLLTLSVIAPALAAEETLSPPAGNPAPLPLPTADAAAAAGRLPNPAAPSAAAPSLLQTMAAAKRGLCARWRSSPLGHLLANLRKPLSAVTGGLVPADKKPHPDQQGHPGPQGTAAQVKAAKLEAPARQAAIQSLAGVDVRYHPEAEAALIAALRTDPTECVRLQAAETIAHLPICSPGLRKALEICFEGKASDGNPAELSPRVRWQASLASNHCQSCQPSVLPAPEERPEYPPQAPSPGMVAPASAEFPAGQARRRAAGSLELPITRSLQLGGEALGGETLDGSALGRKMLGGKMLERLSLNESPAGGLADPLPLPRAAPPMKEIASPAAAKPRTLLDVFRAASERPAPTP